MVKPVLDIVRYKDLLQANADFLNDQEWERREGDDYDCPICKNREGFMRIKMVNIGKKDKPSYFPYEYWEPCECVQFRKIEKNTKASGLESYRLKTFDNFKTLNSPFLKNLKTEAVKNSDEPFTWFFIGGKSGSGKSHITAAIANSLINKGMQVMYTSWLNNFRETNYINDAAERKRNINKLFEVDNLLIDDLFKLKKGESPTSADIQLLMRVLNARLNSNKKTIISSEWTMRELLEVDEATASRIAEKCKGYVFTVGKDVKNYRLRDYA